MLPTQRRLRSTACLQVLGRRRAARHLKSGTSLCGRSTVLSRSQKGTQGYTAVGELRETLSHPCNCGCHLCMHSRFNARLHALGCVASAFKYAAYPPQSTEKTCAPARQYLSHTAQPIQQERCLRIGNPSVCVPQTIIRPGLQTRRRSQARPAPLCSPSPFIQGV